MTTRPRQPAKSGLVLAVSLGLAAAAVPVNALARTMPEIRTSAANSVPACVTPDRLMSFLRTRNSNLAPQFRDIARHYKTYGEAWRVRWDYAFFQMAVETNFLTYRAPNGRMGDVDPRQNNFAGIGTTGGGVPGDSFPDVKTGVHAQIQHLVVYSGERLAAPIAPRTQLKQDHILQASLALQRPVRFNDLARRWAVDPKYDTSIEWVAGIYRSRYCTGRNAAEAEPAPADNPSPRLAEAPRPAERGAHPAVKTVWRRGDKSPPPAAPSPSPASKAPAAAPRALPETPPGTIEAAFVPTALSAEAAPSPALPAAPPPGAIAAAATPAIAKPAGLGAAELACTVGTASYGGTRSVLIKSNDGGQVRYTALSVLAGFERSMTDSFIKARAPRGEAIGEFDNREAALDMAHTLCPTAQ